MNKQTMLWVIGFAAIGYGAYKYFGDTVKAYATIIAASGASSNLQGLLTFDKPYLKAWAKGVKDKQPTFTYNGLIYNTQGGTVKK